MGRRRLAEHRNIGRSLHRKSRLGSSNPFFQDSEVLRVKGSLGTRKELMQGEDATIGYSKLEGSSFHCILVPSFPNIRPA